LNGTNCAFADSADPGLVQVLTKPGTDKILVVTIVGAHAGGIISEYILVKGVIHYRKGNSNIKSSNDVTPNSSKMRIVWVTI